MATVKVAIEGMEDAQAALRRFPDQARDAMSDVIQKTVFAARQRMAAAAPRGATGRLRGSLTATVRGLSGRVLMEGDAYYWRFLEHGTRYITARPFVRPAAEAEANEVPKRIVSMAAKLERDFGTSRFT
jgi:HK97 gp10 family phage protein